MCQITSDLLEGCHQRAYRLNKEEGKKKETYNCAKTNWVSEMFGVKFYLENAI
jgi:hypothetical protein